MLMFKDRDAHLIVTLDFSTAIPAPTVSLGDYAVAPLFGGPRSLIVSYTCNYAGDAARFYLNGSLLAGGPLTFANQGNHTTVVSFAAIAVTTLPGWNSIDINRTAFMGDDVRINSLAFA